MSSSRPHLRGGRILGSLVVLLLLALAASPAQAGATGSDRVQSGSTGSLRHPYSDSDAEADLGDLKVYARIVGGRPARIAEWPFFTSLSDGPLPGQSPYCGASLIRSRWVLTAAHCVQNADRLFVTIGRDRMKNPESPGEGHWIRRIFVHPSYDEMTYRWDAALLQLPRRSGRKTIDLAEATPDEGESVKVAGFGLEREGGVRLSSRLKETDLRMVDDQRCTEIYSAWMHVPSMTCAWELDTDSCQGDSGGPLVHQGKLIGLVSWGEGCARPHAPGVYTRVASIGSWIDRVIARTGQTTVLRAIVKWRRGEAGAAYLYGHFNSPVRSAHFRFAKAVRFRGRPTPGGRWVRGLRDGLSAGITDLSRHRSACSAVKMKVRFDDRTIVHTTRICLPRQA